MTTSQWWDRQQVLRLARMCWCGRHRTGPPFRMEEVLAHNAVVREMIERVNR